MFNPERNKNKVVSLSDQIKEKSILQKFPVVQNIKQKPILTCEPDEVILQSILII